MEALKMVAAFRRTGRRKSRATPHQTGALPPSQVAGCSLILHQGATERDIGERGELQGHPLLSPRAV